MSDIKLGDIVKAGYLAEVVDINDDKIGIQYFGSATDRIFFYSKSALTHVSKNQCCKNEGGSKMNLLEVSITSVILLIGFLGNAHLQIQSMKMTKQNHDAIIAAFELDSEINRWRATNPTGCKMFGDREECN